MSYRYDVALSFAGEDREYVREVAQILKNSGVKVFYDEFEEASLWGSNLFVYLKEIYSNHAKYTIIFCSKHYAEKLWTNHERESAQERVLREKEIYILPAKFDNTKIPGFLDTTCYIDLCSLTPYDFCKIVATKLNVKIITLPKKTEVNEFSRDDFSDKKSQNDKSMITNEIKAYLDIEDYRSIMTFGSSVEGILSNMSYNYIRHTSADIENITRSLSNINDTINYVIIAIKKLILPSNIMLKVTGRNNKRIKFICEIPDIVENLTNGLERLKIQLLRVFT